MYRKGLVTCMFRRDEVSPKLSQNSFLGLVVLEATSPMMHTCVSLKCTQIYSSEEVDSGRERETEREREKECVCHGGSAGGIVSCPQQKFMLTNYCNHLRILISERKSVVCLGQIRDRKNKILIALRHPEISK